MLRGDVALEASVVLYKYLALVVATSIVAASIVFGLSSAGSQPSLSTNVRVSFEKGAITVSVKLPGPQYYSYYYYYYYYYSQGNYSSQAIPVTVVISIEKLVEANGREVPVLTGVGGVYNLEAFGPNNELNVTFHLTPGHYRVKVLFWNNLLPILADENKAWKPLAKPFIQEGNVS